MYDLLMTDKEYLNNNNFKILNINLPNQFFCMVILPVKCGGVMPLDGISVEINFIKT